MSFDLRAAVVRGAGEWDALLTSLLVVVLLRSGSRRASTQSYIVPGAQSHVMQHRTSRRHKPGTSVFLRSSDVDIIPEEIHERHSDLMSSLFTMADGRPWRHQQCRSARSSRSDTTGWRRKNPPLCNEKFTPEMVEGAQRLRQESRDMRCKNY